MFKKQDDDFDELVADPVRRRAQIVSLSQRRTVVFICASVLAICALIEIWAGGRGRWEECLPPRSASAPV
jgi:hypothetical protein